MSSNETTDLGHGVAVVETTLDWRDLHLHVLTRDAPTDSELESMRAVVSRVKQVGSFADALGMIYGRRVHIRTTRPSPDIWFEVGL